MTTTTPSGDPPGDPLAGFAPRHPAAARLVLESLKVLSEAGDPEIRRWAGDVLEGRRSVRDLPDPSSVPGAVESTLAGYGSMSDDERAELARQGRDVAEDLLRDGPNPRTRHE